MQDDHVDLFEKSSVGSYFSPFMNNVGVYRFSVMCLVLSSSISSLTIHSLSTFYAHFNAHFMHIVCKFRHIKLFANHGFPLHPSLRSVSNFVFLKDSAESLFLLETTQPICSLSSRRD